MSTTTATPRFADIGMTEIEAILEHARECGLPENEIEILRTLMASYSFLLDELRDKKTSIQRLRKLLFGARTETRANVEDAAGKASVPKDQETPSPGGDGSPGDEGAPPEEEGKKKGKGHGRTAAAAFTGAKKEKVRNGELHAGDRCPHCPGRVYGKEPAVLLRIRACAPLAATVFELERLRCNLCGEVFTAKAPAGVGEEKFDESVTSQLAFYRYGNGMPMNRFAGMLKAVGIPMPVSTQWDLLRDGAAKLAAVYEELVRQAGQGIVLYNDDTPMRILDHLAEKRRRKERGEAEPARTGTFTSGIVSEFADGRRIVLYFTGHRHAGENLYEVLKRRASGLDPPIQMCDGLDRNLPGELETILSNCLVHARRHFVDVVTSFPDEVTHLVDELAIVYANDAATKALGMTAEERLRYHQEKSGPVMDRVEEWMEGLLAEREVEPNSGVGQAIRYSQKRWERLTLFLRMAGAPLDNSLTERMLKKAILHRRNSLFYKTENGARVGDLFMGLIATAKLAQANPFRYLTELLRHADEAAADPAAWMPWNFDVALGARAGTPSASRA